MTNNEKPTKTALPRKSKPKSLRARTDMELIHIDLSLPISDHLKPELFLLIRHHDVAIKHFKDGIDALKKVTAHTARILTIHEKYNL